MKAVYMITNLRNGYRYVGYSNNIRRRMGEHFAPSNIGKNSTLLCKALLEYSKSDFKMEILEEVDDESILPEREEFWIYKLSPEYNRVAGGRGAKGLIVTDEVKSRLSESTKKQWLRMSEEQKTKIISQNLTGRKPGFKHTQETIEKLRQASSGVKQSQETISKRSAKLKVSAIGNKNGNKSISSYSECILVKTYKSVKEAADELGCHPSTITHVLKGKRKTCKGFSWRYGV